jgi:hypothetical protein
MYNAVDAVWLRISVRQHLPTRAAKRSHCPATPDYQVSGDNGMAQQAHEVALVGVLRQGPSPVRPAQDARRHR